MRKKNVKNENMSELMRELERRELVKEIKKKGNKLNAFFSEEDRYLEDGKHIKDTKNGRKRKKK